MLRDVKTIGAEVANIDRTETLQIIKNLITAADNQIRHQALGTSTRCVLEGGQNISFAQRLQLNELGLSDDPCAMVMTSARRCGRN